MSYAIKTRRTIPATFEDARFDSGGVVFGCLGVFVVWSVLIGVVNSLSNSRGMSESRNAGGGDTNSPKECFEIEMS